MEQKAVSMMSWCTSLKVKAGGTSTRAEHESMLSLRPSSAKTVIDLAFPSSYSYLHIWERVAPYCHLHGIAGGFTGHRHDFSVRKDKKDAATHR